MRNSFGPPGMGEKRRQALAAGKRERCPGGRSLRDRTREGGGEVGAKIDRSGFNGFKMVGDRG